MVASIGLLVDSKFTTAYGPISILFMGISRAVSRPAFMSKASETNCLITTNQNTSEEEPLLIEPAYIIANEQHEEILRIPTGYLTKLKHYLTEQLKHLDFLSLHFQLRPTLFFVLFAIGSLMIASHLNKESCHKRMKDWHGARGMITITPTIHCFAAIELLFPLMLLKLAYDLRLNLPTSFPKTNIRRLTSLSFAGALSISGLMALIANPKLSNLRGVLGLILISLGHFLSHYAFYDVKEKVDTASTKVPTQTVLQKFFKPQRNTKSTSPVESKHTEDPGKNPTYSKQQVEIL